MWQAHGGRDRFAVKPGLADQTRCPTTQGRRAGPLATLASNAKRVTEYAAKQAAFASHDLVS